MKSITGFFVYAIILLGGLFLSGPILEEVLGEGRTFWEVLGCLAAPTAIATVLWFGGNRKQLERKDAAYTTALALEKEMMGIGDDGRAPKSGPKGRGEQAKQKKKTQKKPSFLFQKKWLGVLFWVGLLCIYGSCSYSIGQIDMQEEAHQTVWNAENIPLPHLTDGSQYVSNPDTLLTQESVDSINIICQQLDKNFGVESAVIIVRHIQNEDAFRMAQDVGNRYGVGNKETNRGLVIVVAYDDRRYFIAPGRGLEGDMTDAECNRLAVNYLKPYMQASDPDGAMKQLLQATLRLLEGKDLPPVVDPADKGGEADDPIGDLIMWVFMLLFGWTLPFVALNQRYQWADLSSGSGFTGYGRDRSYTGSSWGSSWGGGRNFGGGFGGFGGGGYGGGSFGGGGAGGGW